jgi:hypothetical protein
MHTSLNPSVGVRGLAIIILMFVACWYVSIFECAVEDMQQWIWAVPLILFTFLIIGFMPMLLLSYWRSGKAHQRWFWAAVASVASCVVFVGWLFILHIFV